MYSKKKVVNIAHQTLTKLKYLQWKWKQVACCPASLLSEMRWNSVCALIIFVETIGFQWFLVLSRIAGTLHWETSWYIYHPVLIHEFLNIIYKIYFFLFFYILIFSCLCNPALFANLKFKKYAFYVGFPFINSFYTAATLCTSCVKKNKQLQRKVKSIVSSTFLFQLGKYIE